MTLFLLLLFLAAELPAFLISDDNENINFEDLTTTRVSVQEEIVNKHNQLRRMVSPPGSDLLKMQWSNDAQVNAQRWANFCYYIPSPPRARATNLSCGENIYMTSYSESWSRVIQRWYDEAKDFMFGSGPKSPDEFVEHYTQIVWNSSYQVGCGVANCPDQILENIYICHYCPHGNAIGRQYTPYTVGQPCALCPDHCDNGLCTNSCEYDNKYPNCEHQKALLTCEWIKQDCKAACNCEGKIH